MGRKPKKFTATRKKQEKIKPWQIRDVPPSTRALFDKIHTSLEEKLQKDLTQPNALLEIFKIVDNGKPSGSEPALNFDPAKEQELKEAYPVAWSDQQSLEDNVFSCINFERQKVLDINEELENTAGKLNQAEAEKQKLSEEIQSKTQQLEAALQEYNDLLNKRSDKKIDEWEVKYKTLSEEYTILEENFRNYKAHDNTQELEELKQQNELLSIKVKKLQSLVDDKPQGIILKDTEFICQFDQALIDRIIENKANIKRYAKAMKGIDDDNFPEKLAQVSVAYFIDTIEALS